VAATRPPRVEYRLTPSGRRLGALVDAMRAYAAQA
jgi:DNA-binding HxlR family transcriptional regulator